MREERGICEGNIEVINDWMNFGMKSLLVFEYLCLKFVRSERLFIDISWYPFQWQDKELWWFDCFKKLEEMKRELSCDFLWMEVFYRSRVNIYRGRNRGNVTSRWRLHSWWQRWIFLFILLNENHHSKFSRLIKRKREREMKKETITNIVNDFDGSK